ncbi:hypothetical protein HMPREF9565_02415 [Cutibacterium acnes HL053PA2]|nr:hypothetical protein HMPREF9575_02633 [Cutibacterium acnes HL110PA1]EFT30843.1 hypothetical protein HMPREF9595_01822 [Cutibacterium acnes HL005PA2]EFT49533.1 hypothetical protein HMPREF9565_02415 [Cutibacterium acnes HL053PA2]EFT52192.1 hypothetical protein HMPREF9569_02430 [Cutibacterium acnes HL078PA1]EGF66435.1 hypothetical protein HMPREF9579_02361 [Cutibacterium acnes HL087PA1]
MRGRIEEGNVIEASKAAPLASNVEPAWWHRSGWFSHSLRVHQLVR